MARKEVTTITAIQDTREQEPLWLEREGVKVEVDTLPFGDYTLRHPDLSELVIVERKSLDDFLACCGRERKRFEKELLALRGYKFAYCVIESNMTTLATGQYRSEISPQAVVSSVAKWSTWGIRFVFADSHELASVIVARLFRFHAERVLQWSRSKVENSPLAGEQNATILEGN